MNRWPGNKEDSSKQVSERNSTAARRFINSIPSLNASLNSVSSLDFYDCQESDFENLDGNLETPEDSDKLENPIASTSSASTKQSATMAELFEDKCAEDDKNAWQKSLTVKFNKTMILTLHQNSCLLCKPNRGWIILSAMTQDQECTARIRDNLCYLTRVQLRLLFLLNQQIKSIPQLDWKPLQVRNYSVTDDN